MRSVKSIIWGLVIVALGVLLGLRAFDVINFEIFFDGWWTLFIIVPCAIGVITDDDKVGNLIGLGVGTFLLLACNDVLSYEYIWKLLIPVTLVIIGLSFIFKNIFINRVTEKVKKSASNKEVSATFSGQRINFDNQKFEGSKLDAIFGGIDLDLRKAKIEEDVMIEASAVFGGVDILVPANCKIKVISNSIFGGVNNKVKRTFEEENAPTIYINATCIFGGIDIK